MDKATKRRWAILSGVSVITLAAIAYPLEQEKGARSPVKPPRPTNLAATATPPLPVDAQLAADAAEPEADPFAPRNWHAPPIAIVMPPSVPAEPALPPAPFGPPALPFRFTGRMNDGNEQVLYLSRGDQVLIVRSGETLEGTYKVLAVEARTVEFVHLPTGEKQSLSLPAED